MRTAFWREPASLLLAAGGLLAAAAVLASDGSSDDRLAWIGGAAIVLAAAGVGVAAVGALAAPRLSRFGAAFLVLFAAFVAWNGLSVVWSIEPDRSWNYFNRGLVYLAFALVGVLLGANVRRAPQLVAIGLAAIVAVVVSWALAVKMIPAIAPDNGRIARLHTPIGYWNALALLVDIALPPALWLAARREQRWLVRVAATLVVYGSVVALLLTYSRAGILAGIVAVSVFVALSRPRFETVAVLAVGGGPAVAVALWAFTRDGLAKNLQPHSARVHDGAWFALVFVLVAVVVGAAAFLGVRYEERRAVPEHVRRLLARVAWGGLAAALVVAAIWIGVVANPHAWLDEFSRTPSRSEPQAPDRLTTLSSPSRWQWWTEAWQAFQERPALGTGSGSFVVTDHLLRPINVYVTEPHSVPIQFLSETGIVGLLLFVGFVGCAVAAVVGRLRGLCDTERLAATAVATGALAYLLHSLVDFDWDFVAVTGPLFLVVGVLVASPAAERRRREGALLAAAASVAALAALYSLGAPWLARRDTGAALDALDRGHIRAAASKAKHAHDLNPLSVQPLLVWASAEESRGDGAEARRLYVRAVDIQPLNWRPWFQLGYFELTTGRLRPALAYLTRASELDPNNTSVRLTRDYVARQLGKPPTS